jgi:hypothetical protein
MKRQKVKLFKESLLHHHLHPSGLQEEKETAPNNRSLETKRGGTTQESTPNFEVDFLNKEKEF